MVKSDYDAVAELWQSSEDISFSESDDRYHIECYLQENPDCSFVACDGNKIVGTVLAGEDARRGFINHLFVLPEYREQGIATQLLKCAEDALKKCNPTKVYLFVKTSNKDAINFWKKQKYYLCEDFITMRKSLSTESYEVYEELEEQAVANYLSRCDFINEPVDVEEFGDGNMNHIFRVTCGEHSYILKQAMPHGKIDVTVFEPMDRAIYENAYVRYYSQYMPEKLEKQLWFDLVMCINIYEDLSYMKILRQCLLNGELREKIGVEIGEYLAQQYYYSSSLYLSIEDKKIMESSFSNMRMRQLTEEFILVNPFEDSSNNNIDADIMPFVEKIWSNKAVCSKAKYLVMKFVSNKECLISGDFHPGNVFVDDKKCIFFDFDFAMWGPIAYDLGTMLGNLIISYETSEIYNAGNMAHKEQIAEIMVDMFDAFRKKMREQLKKWDESIVDMMLDEIVGDAVGYAAATIAGRTYGYARFKEIIMLDGKQQRVEIISRLVNIVIELLSRKIAIDDLLRII